MTNLSGVKKYSQSTSLRLTVLVIATLAGSVTSSGFAAVESQPVWAVNVGGGAVQSAGGLLYEADNCTQPAICQSVAKVQGAQLAAMYRSYRTGDNRWSKKLADGRYDITLHFIEPDETAIGARIFDVIAEDKVLIDDLDVRKTRDGRVRSGLSRTIANVMVNDGELTLELKASVGSAVISGFDVFKRVEVQADQWQLVWADEFAGPIVNPDNWTAAIWPAGKVNAEDQTYTKRKKNLRTENGLLVIEAHHEAFRGAEYSSARIHSSGKMDMRYGKVEVRAKLPVGQGTWPAIWMMPTDPYFYATNCDATAADWEGSRKCDAWPNSGEIDIMEHVGYDPGIVHGTVHTQAYYWVNWEQRKGSIQVADAQHAFHRYALEWGPDYLTTFVDDVPYFTYYRDGDWRSWPFDHPFHVIINFAVGGGWGRAGGPIDNSVYPQRFEVDYVRAYQLNPAP